MYKDLTVRCYGECRDGQWLLVCLDFSLVSQAESFDAALKSLDHQIACYVRDALVGEDREHAGALLRRRAPFGYWVRYYVAKFFAKRDELQRSFREPLPLRPAMC